MKLNAFFIFFCYGFMVLHAEANAVLSVDTEGQAKLSFDTTSTSPEVPNFSAWSDTALSLETGQLGLTRQGVNLGGLSAGLLVPGRLLRFAAALSLAEEDVQSSQAHSGGVATSSRAASDGFRGISFAAAGLRAALAQRTVYGELRDLVALGGYLAASDTSLVGFSLCTSAAKVNATEVSTAEVSTTNESDATPGAPVSSTPEDSWWFDLGSLDAPLTLIALVDADQAFGLPGGRKLSFGFLAGLSSTPLLGHEEPLVDQKAYVDASGFTALKYLGNRKDFINSIYLGGQYQGPYFRSVWGNLTDDALAIDASLRLLLFPSFYCEGSAEASSLWQRDELAFASMSPLVYKANLSLNYDTVRALFRLKAILDALCLGEKHFPLELALGVGSAEKIRLRFDVSHQIEASGAGLGFWHLPEEAKLSLTLKASVLASAFSLVYGKEADEASGSNNLRMEYSLTLKEILGVTGSFSSDKNFCSFTLPLSDWFW